MKTHVRPALSHWTVLRCVRSYPNEAQTIFQREGESHLIAIAQEKGELVDIATRGAGLLGATAMPKRSFSPPVHRREHHGSGKHDNPLPPRIDKAGRCALI